MERVFSNEISTAGFQVPGNKVSKFGSLGSTVEENKHVEPADELTDEQMETTDPEGFLRLHACKKAQKRHTSTNHFMDAFISAMFKSLQKITQ